MAQLNDLLVLGKSNLLDNTKITGLLSADGGIALNSNTASGTLSYILGIKPFAEGGNVIWSATGNVTVGNATTAANCTGNSATATALTSSAGAINNPVYFTGGKPAATIWTVGNQNYGEHDCNNVTYNFSGYYTSNGPATSLGATTADGSLWAQAYSTAWVSQIAQDYRDGGLFVRGKNNGTWQAWKAIPMTTTASVGSATLPVYINAGTVTQCGTSLAVSITGNAATATKATQDGNGATISSTYLKLSGGTMTGTINLVENNVGINYRSANASYYTTSTYLTGGNEALVFATKNAVTSFMFVNGEDSVTNHATTRWQDLTPGLQIKNNCVSINKLIANGVTPTYQLEVGGTIYGTSVWGAVWNDYAEFRKQSEKVEPGYCVVSADDGSVSKTTEKFQACDGIVTDTFGFAIGQTDECKTPLAVAGRVLAYCEGSRYDYHAGDTVCAGPEGKVVKMTREEIREYPERIVGTVSEIPEYDTWGTGNVPVNGRIWIKVK